MSIAPLKVAFLNVGHGDSIVIILPQKENEAKRAIIIDSPNCIVTKHFLDKNDIKILELVIISHSHLDHSKGIVPLVEKFIEEGKEIKRLVYKPDTINYGSEQSKYKKLMRSLVTISDDNGIYPINPIIEELEKIIYNDVQTNFKISILYPNITDLADAIGRNNCNDTSTVIEVEYNGFKVLLPGDLESKGWYRLYKKLKPTIADVGWQVLKLPHHGDYYFLSEEMLCTEQILDFVKPKIGIISSAQNDNYQHPDINTVNKLKEKSINIYCTQVTDICHCKRDEVKSNIMSILEARDFSENSECCPCSGDIIVAISDKIEIEPSNKCMTSIKKLFEYPKCI